MNKAKLKTYAPQARKDFIAAVTARANQLGLAGDGDDFSVAPATRQGDVTLINGRDWPAEVHQQRERLIKRMQRDGFAQTIEAVAYTWFNRFAALRYMELHDYLEHGYRVLSSAAPAEGAAHTPDILLHAVDLAQSRNLPGLSSEQIGQLKLAGNQDGELYRLLLVAQCNALSAAMPFLFERIDDETELLLPDNLLRTDSVIAKLVAEIPEEDWAEVEIIGWLYQFYISEKKDQVIGKVVKSEDIPAATQLFTPNWIVQYLVQNSVGRLWLMANPTSTLKSEWPYYIEPAEQTPEVNAQLDALIQTRMAEDGGSLNPEFITVLDPACGSGHILVEAYALLKGIYLERGYRLRDIPRLILEKNLYGLDIDDRAAQLAGFALLMKARADDRRLFNDPPRLNVLSLQESKGLDLDELAPHLAPFGVQRATVKVLLDSFEHAKTFGSLIQIPDALNAQLPALAEALGKAGETGDLYAQAAAQDLLPLVEQAQVLGRKFDAVVANPPYMGGKGMNPALKDYARATFPDSKADLFAMFMERGFGWCKPSGFNSMVTMHTWMFLSSYEAMRDALLIKHSLVSLLHLPYDGKGPTAMGISFGIDLAVFQSQKIHDINSSFDCYRYFELDESGIPNWFPSKNERNVIAKQDDLRKIPGSPIAYWISKEFRELFAKHKKLGQYLITRQGLATGDNDRFTRLWHEVPIANVSGLEESQNENSKWFLFIKGGDFRKWFGNIEHVVNWRDSGSEIKGLIDTAGRQRSRPQSVDYYFRENIVCAALTSGTNAFRFTPRGAIFDVNTRASFSIDLKSMKVVLAILNSNIMKKISDVLSPTMALNIKELELTPIPDNAMSTVVLENCTKCISIARNDWNGFESSHEFKELMFVGTNFNHPDISSAWSNWEMQTQRNITEMKRIEEDNNRIFISAYGLQDELSPEVPESQITLTRADREKDSQRLISYAIGCMMGRYSLDEPGLIYAHAGNVGFDPTRYKTFPADADGIVPITDEFWFEDDAANRVREFLCAVWGADTLDENMAWLAESLGTKAGETPDETIRRYLADKFFKDHLQTYKKRPIYWLFSSGKQGAFQALVYLHRYHEGTLARLRAEYVVPLTGKLQARIDMLEKDAESASTATRNKINKQIEKLRKKHVELLAYDEKLRHHADLRIQLDLDDGVKVNYGKFGDLLAEVKAVTGGAGDE